MSPEIRGIDFTEAQYKAVKTLDQNLAINAGAGTGKTRVLTERYLEILLTPFEEGGLMYQKDALEKIIAITFTRKATSEMKERIRERLEKYLTENDLAPQEEEWVLYIIDNLAKSRISTFHSFCKDILKSNFFKAGIDANFKILEGIEKQRLAEKAIINTLDKIRNDEEHQLYQCLWRLTYTYDKDELVSILTEMLNNRNRLSSLSDQEDLTDLIHNLIIKVIQDYLTDSNIKEKVNQLAAYTPVEDSDGVQVVKNILKLYDRLNSTLKSYSTNETEENKLKLIELHFKFMHCFYNFEKDKNLSIYRAMKAAHWEGGNESKKAVNSLHKELRGLVLDLTPFQDGQPLVVAADDKTKEAESLKLLLAVYQLVKSEYDNLKAQEGALDFLDLEEKVIKLFKEDYQLVEQLREEIQFMMIDEMQDNNYIQWDIIQPLLTTDPEYQHLAKGKLFIVGDPKQSIYGFRRADVRIFNHVVEEIEASSDFDNLIKLKNNFRSNQGIIDFVNTIFPQIMKNESEYDVSYENLICSRHVNSPSEVKENAKSHIEVLVTPKQGSDDEYSNAQYEAYTIAAKIDWLVNESDQKIVGKDQLTPVNYGDIAILMRSRSRLKEYEKALDEYGIDYQTVDGRGFYQNQEIYDIYLALKSLIYPEDDLNTFGLMRSPLFCLSDDELFSLKVDSKEKGFSKESLLRRVFAEYSQIKNVFAKWLELKDKVSIDVLIETILTDCGAFASYLAGAKGKQRLANIEKLIQEAAEFSYQQNGSLYQFVKELADLIENETAQAAGEITEADLDNKVKLMTVHASKGKEFPVVFLANMNSRGRNQTSKVLGDNLAQTDCLGVKYYDQNLVEQESKFYGILKDQLKEKERMEEKRIFYVAVTRTQDFLFLSGTVSKDRTKLNKSFKWLLKDGLDYDLKNFLSSTDYRDKITRACADRELEVNITESQVDIDLDKTQLEFEEIAQDFEVKTLIADPKFDKEVKTPSQLTAEKLSSQDSGSKNEAVCNLVKSKNEAALKGSIVHKAIELIVQGLEINYDYLFNLYPDHTKYPSLKTEVIKIVERIKECSEFNRLLKFDLQPEVEFYLEREGDMISGTIDLLFKDDEGVWNIVDWKTTRVTSEVNLDKQIKKHKPQMQTYEEAIKEMKEGKVVRSYIYFTEAESGNRLKLI
ncbi:UvrD-helicase domain-containing protein [Fuchsiella alkaliacetigena]|uniref:UvrD-helicase domain-containing protein n=1 Tax=Fuchsiella alkaliacetigena TaxID=957042 RepID=UPI00200AB15F|nr:UvrD-helicase domain-containing protein [Fuchsiella alkaliacetigena]MCK8825249.1 UvrD-helicase domain-containing protein [Fuchsiella alkaliacetigena]